VILAKERGLNHIGQTNLQATKKEMESLWLPHKKTNLLLMMKFHS
jgi:hypothetical protein